MGARLVPIVRNFRISREVFTVGSPDVLDGCITPGAHRLLRFDVLCHNSGDADIVVGAPSARPDLFRFSAVDGRYYLHDFVHVLLKDEAGNQVAAGHKRSFCLIDVERIDAGARGTPQFTECNVQQGISAGWADLYPAHLKCQYVVLDGVADGTYLLQVRIDVKRILPDAPPDSSVMMKLRLAGDSVVPTGGAGPGSWPAQPPPGLDVSPPPRPESPSPPTALEGFARDVLDVADPMLRELFAAFEGLRTTINTSVAEHDWVAVSWTRTGMHVGPYRGLPPSRRSVEVSGVSIARLEHGRIAEQWDVADLGWLRAIGQVAISALEPPE